MTEDTSEQRGSGHVGAQQESGHAVVDRARGTSAVRVDGAHKTYPGGRRLFDDLHLDVAHGEFVALLGPSGSGKSTLLRVLAGLDTLDEGTVDLSGSCDQGSDRPNLGVVFQDPHLFDWLTVRENVQLGSRFAATRDRHDSGRTDEMLAHFGIDDLADRYPDQLSGGQAQRVAIVRAASLHPRLLLLDEPFSGLDPLTRAELQTWLRDLTAELGSTVILVTHDVDEALLLGSRIALLQGTGTVSRTWSGIAEARASGDLEALRRAVLDEYRAPAAPAAGLAGRGR